MVNNSKSDRKNNVEEIVLRGIISVMENRNDTVWIGTMTNLTSALNRVLSKHQRTFLPSSPSALRMVMNKVVNRLRSRGIGVKFGRSTDHTRTRYVRFAR